MCYKVVDAILLFGGKDTTFPRNFQGFCGKYRDGDKEKIGGSQNLRVAYKLYIFVMK